MPMFEYVCLDCKNEFELLVRSNERLACPSCGRENLQKKFSAFATVSKNSNTAICDSCTDSNYGSCGYDPHSCGCPNGACGCGS